MQRSLMWIATAALLATVLGGQGEVVGMTAPHAANGPAGNGIASTPPGDSPRHARFETILHAPSTFDCHGDHADTDVFELQCESNISNN